MGTPAQAITGTVTGPGGPAEPVPVALVARTSTLAMQDPVASLNRQIRSCRQWLPAGWYIAGYYWDETRGDSALTDQQKRDYINKGLDAVNKALSIKPDYVEAITFKGLLLRLEANVEKDPAKQQALLKEATELSDKANDLRKQKTTGTSD